jgi:hypothetical protein
MEQLCRTYTRQLATAETPAGAASCVAVDEMSIASDDATTAGEPTDGVEAADATEKDGLASDGLIGLLHRLFASMQCRPQSGCTESVESCIGEAT